MSDELSGLMSVTDKLRERARVLRQGDWSDGADDAALMEQAADTIDAMLDRLYELQHVSCDSRWHELFGTPEKAARMLAKHCAGYHCTVCPAHHHNCGEGDYDALLEWLRGDAE